MKILRDNQGPAGCGGPLRTFIFLPSKGRKPRLLPLLPTAALLMGLLFHLSPARALEIAPFEIQNQSPLVTIYGLPPVGEASLVPAGRVDGRFSLDLANNFIEISKDSPRGEELVLDGESARATLDFRYGITPGKEVGIRIPYLVLGGGFLDSSIESFHSATGAGQGLRPLEPRNRFLYYYEKDGRLQFYRDRSSQGLGDIRLTGGWQAFQSPSGAVALRASLKLPTGERFLGSGSTDLSLWVTARRDFGAGGGRIAVFGGAGLLAKTEGDLLPDQQRPLVCFGNIGAGWSPVSWLAVKAQIDGLTPFYKDSELRPLGRSSLMGTFGVTLAFSPQTTLDIGVAEDLEYNTAPDVIFHLSLRHRF